ncbi:hypothetical protein [Staphylococcus edaphicus]|nr:hypothetical protein [Staphylococcus edaphicus]
MDMYFLTGVFNKHVQLIEDTDEGIKYYTKAPAPVHEFQAEIKS